MKVDYIYDTHDLQQRTFTTVNESSKHESRPSGYTIHSMSTLSHEKSLSGKIFEATNDQKYKTFINHCEAMIIHMLTSPA
jgi:hypothetical protein